jgi:kynurenine formamidase
MKYLLPFILLLIFSCNNHQKESSLANEVKKGHWVDLTYSFSDETLYWPTAEKFRFDTAFVGETPAGFYYEAYNFCAAEHGGTHLDAPVHFAKGKWASDEIPMDRLCGEAVLIDVSDSCGKQPDYQIRVADMENWEKKNGRIPDDIILIFKTGFGLHYPDAKKYLGTAERGAAAVAKLHFPGIHPDAAKWLVANRNIKAVGLDAASVDYGQSVQFETHRILYEKNIYGLENVANLDSLPVKGAYIMALPMKIKGGSGGPLRLAAWVPGK